MPVQGEGTWNHLLVRTVKVTLEEEQVRWEAIVAAIFEKYNLPGYVEGYKVKSKNKI